MTTVLNAYSIAYPTISNRIKAVIYKASDPLAEVASIIDAVAGHPARTWNFPGLERTNYIFKLVEINGSDVVVQTLADFGVVPGEIDGLLTREEEQITEGETTGFDSGVNNFTFDGSAGKPDWRGWEINVEILGGIGTLVKSVQYTWDKVTGYFELQEEGNEIAPGTVWNIRFDAQESTLPESAPTNSDMPVMFIDADTTLTAADFGKKLIVEPAGNFLTVTLPMVDTVVEGRFLDVDIEAGLIHKTVKFVTQDGQPIAWLQVPRTAFYACCNESFRIYKYNRPGQSEFRITLPFGNFLKVGHLIYSDMDSSNILNAVLASGSSLDILQYARLYEEFVLQLAPAQVCNFDDWSTGNNKYKFSLANSSNPANANKFKIPDRRGIVQKNTADGSTAGVFEDQQLVEHSHFMLSETDGGNTPPDATSGIKRIYLDGGNSGYNLRKAGATPNIGRTSLTGGSENRIKTYSNNPYILI